MHYVNRIKLKQKMIEYNLKMKDIAKALNISIATIHFKMNGRDFSENEIYILHDMFGDDIFFE